MKNLFSFIKKLFINIRNWLKRNKIFFEILGWIGLGFMSLFLSLSSNRIASYQAKLIETDYLPIFNFNIETNFDSIEEIYADEILKIFNEGASISEFKCRPMIFYDIEWIGFNKDKKLSLIDKTFPIADYYSETFYKGNIKGEMVELRGIKNRLQESRINVDFLNFINKKNHSGSAGITRYVQISYKDVLERKHEDIFFVDSFGRGYKLSTKEAEKVKNNFKIEYMLELREITPELLYQRIMEKNTN